MNIFTIDITNLKCELGASDTRAEAISRVLDANCAGQFLSSADAFLAKTRMTLSDYQNIAFLTARTSDQVLVEVCLAVLSQLTAELFRRTLPAVELELNRTLPDRETNTILGEIAWHVAALTSLFNLSLDDVAQKNVEKVSYRLDRDTPTRLHDDGYPDGQQFPRRFEIEFAPDGQNRSQMFMDGAPLGDPLTDNAYDDDGYRFHDVMHLANIAKLGWSPVMRKLMDRKRRDDPTVDEVEVGARALIVEEALVKLIHSHGVRIERSKNPHGVEPIRLFSNPNDITFQFLKMIHGFVGGLEVEKNRYWEWEEAIVEGHYLFHRLRTEKRGTVIVDLERRSISYELRPEKTDA